MVSAKALIELLREQEARNQFQRKLVGPPDLTDHFTYDALLEAFWATVNGQPTKIDFRRNNSKSPAWISVVNDVMAKGKQVGPDEDDWINLPKQFKTFDEFKAFIES